MVWQCPNLLSGWIGADHCTMGLAFLLWVHATVRHDVHRFAVTWMASLRSDEFSHCCATFVELWFIPSSAASILISFTTPSTATFNSPLGAQIRTGLNYITLGSRAGFSVYMNWTVTSQSLMQSRLSVVKLTQLPPRSNTSWTLVVQMPGSFYAVLTSANSSAALYFAPTAAFSNVSMSISIAPGATIWPFPFPSVVMLGSRGSSSNVTFTVTSELGTMTSTSVFLIVQLYSATNWNMSISGAQYPALALNSGSAGPLNILRYIYTSATMGVDNSTLTAWMSGDNCSSTPNSVGSWGALGVSSDSFYPSARSGSYAWTGLDSNLYLLGGVDLNGGFMGDFWRYTRHTRQWTLLSGSPTIVNVDPEYVGRFNSSGTPGTRRFACTVLDSSTNMLYMGLGEKPTGPTLVGDIHRNPSLNVSTWVWVAGTNSGNPVYGTKGVSIPAYNTGFGARSNPVCWFANGTMYIFSGFANLRAQRNDM
jgi:hypothetical protein